MAITLAHGRSMIFLISSIVVASSYGVNRSESLSICKSVLRQNCLEPSPSCFANIRIVNKCPSNSTNTEAKEKCENFVNANLLDNILLFVPVTNELENVTYWNMYCAQCNGENLIANRLKFWSVRILHRYLSGFDNSFISDMNSAVKQKIEIHNETKELISIIGARTRNIAPLRYVPFDLKNSSYELCPFGADEGIQFLMGNSTELLTVPESLNCTGKKFCPSENLQIPQSGTCVYFDKNKEPCTENVFLVENLDFVYNGTDIVLKNGSILESNAYFNFRRGAIFICGSIDDASPASRIMYQCVEYIQYLSTFLLFVFLAMKTKKEYFYSLPKLVLYSYCVASLAVYLVSNFNHLFAGRVIFLSYLKLYIYLCYSLWAAIISYEYWFAISKAFKCEKARYKLKTYRIYAFVGWVLPILLLCGVYSFLSEEEKSAVCPWIPNHSNVNLFEHLSGLARTVHSLLILVVALIFIALIPLGILQGYHFIRMVKNKRNVRRASADRRRNPAQPANKWENDYSFIFTKIAYLMGIHWMTLFIAVLLLLVAKESANIIGNVGSVLFAVHGTFIFFAFSVDTVRKKYRSTKSFVTTSTRSSRVDSVMVDIRPGANEDANEDE